MVMLAVLTMTWKAELFVVGVTENENVAPPSRLTGITVANPFMDEGDTVVVVEPSPPPIIFA